MKRQPQVGRRLYRMALLLGFLMLLAGCTPRSAQQVEVSLSEWRVEASSTQVQPGETAFKITNNGTMPHAFQLKQGNTVFKINPIQPGSSDILRAPLEPGSYELICPIFLHADQGMKSTLTVGRTP